MFEALEQLPSLIPLEFFAIQGQLCYAKSAPSPQLMRRNFLLPHTAEWLGEEHFASVAAAWNKEGLFVHLYVEKPFEEAVYPRFSEGDALELFIDTRDRKISGFATRFCHHFLFLPQVVQGIYAQEITHFRTEDTHPLCDPLDLQVTTTYAKRSYEMQIFIPEYCLHGYDPLSFERIGFTYRVHRFKGRPQHFSLNSQHFTLEQHPRLWASFKFSRPLSKPALIGKIDDF
jgi:hypothetical protein